MDIRKINMAKDVIILLGSTGSKVIAEVECVFKDLVAENS